MHRIFAYARVSTIEQHSENQIKEIEAAGFTIEPHRIMTETISGSQGFCMREMAIKNLRIFRNFIYKLLIKS